MKRILSFAIALTIAAAFVAPVFMKSEALASPYKPYYTPSECKKGYKC